ncbi:increased DNA methylation 1-like [Momordica charantia]|uniref:Increased DNA methylation 1-like n=1 Tax=Momordica charantia TaxID=3673 RepID=A0A6J1C5L2_MOMCH|nr:increased DNA methylation 1-like [Momordica charantia]
MAADSCLEKSEETSDDDDDNDADYFPEGYDRSNSRMFTVKFAPQAVVDWYTIALDKSGIKKSTVKNDALGHLLATGWEIYYIQKTKDKRELRYRSPSGKVYISLRTACKAYIDQGAATATATAVPGSSRVKKDSRRRVWKGKQITSDSKKQIHESSDRVKLPVPPVSNLGKRKTSPRTPEAAAETSFSRRRNSRAGLSCLIDQGIVSPGDKVCYKLSGKDPLGWGRITNEGIIRCDCCSNLFRISSFEAHTGSTKRRPAANIFLENGRSLLECLNQLTIIPQIKSPHEKPNNNNKISPPPSSSDKFVPDQNDSVCSVCYFGGELILCDHCPAAFHGSCLGFKAIPLGEWFCPSCCCKICGQGTYDSTGPSPSSSSNHQIDSNFVKCVQCEQKVHVGCVNSIRGLEEDDPNNPNIDRENWFCTQKCENIHTGLQNLLWKEIKIPMGEEGEEDRYLTWTLMKHSTELAAEGTHRKKLNLSLAVMHESFRPVKDPMTKNDLIEDVVYSRRSELKRLNFGGFYTVALEGKNSKVMTVATVRVYGEEVAEVPLVATRLKHRRHGMCRALMKELEQQLMKLGVKKLTLPAVPEALGTWTGAFGFSRMAESDRSELVKYTLLSFQHTVMCQKLLTKRSSDEEDIQWWGLGARKRLKQTAVEDEISDGWNSISDSL